MSSGHGRNYGFEHNNNNNNTQPRLSDLLGSQAPGFNQIERYSNYGRGAVTVHVEDDGGDNYRTFYEYEDGSTGPAAPEFSSRIVRADEKRLKLREYYDKEKCVVCQKIIKRYRRKDAKKLVITNCNHCFHDACFHQWLSYKRFCPNCRTELTWFIEDILNDSYYTITTIHT